MAQRRPLILVTRAAPEAERTAEALRQRGYDGLATPLTVTEPTGEALPAGPFQALLAASAHAAAMLAAHAPLKTLPVFAVGARTAEAFRMAGFADIRATAPDRQSLLERLQAELPPQAACLAALGEDRHEDWLEVLEQAGHSVTRWTVYRARALESASQEAVAALDQGQVAAVLHYSPRQAALFIAAFGERAGLTRHIALSEAVAAALRGAGLDPVVAEAPDEAHLLDALDRALAALPAPAGIGQDGGHHGAGRGMTERTGTEAMAKKSARTDRSAGQPPQDARDDTPENAPGDAVLAHEIPLEPAAEAAAAPAAEPMSATAPEPAPPPARAETRSGPGLPALAIAALLGGGLATAGGLLLPKFWPALAPAPAADPRLGALDARLAALETALAASTRSSGETRAALETATKRLDALAAAPANGTASGAANTALAERLAKLEAAQTDLLKAQREAVDAVRLGREAGENARREAAAITQRLASAEQALKAPVAPPASAQSALKLALLDRVRTNLAGGQPFEAEIAALQSHGLNADTLRPLAGLAKGAPRLAALLDEVRRQRKTLAEDTAETAKSWGDRVLRMADALVQVRRIDGPADAPTPAGLTLQLEQALAAGESARAASIWDRLPEPARRATAKLGQDLAARAAADAALASLTAAELAAATQR